MGQDYSVSRAWRTFLVGVLRPPLMALTKRDWQGAEHIPAEGGVIIAANHVSELDSLTLAHFVYDAGRFPSFLIKSSVFAVPVVGTAMRQARQISVERGGKNAIRSLAEAEEALEAGACVVVFPEGTCTRDPKLWPMVARTGVARLALATGKPVIPVAQFGAHRVLGYKEKIPHVFPRKTTHVLAGPPVDLSAYQDESQHSVATLRAVTSEVMRVVAEQLGRIRGERPPAKPFDPRTASPAPVEPDEDRRSA